MQVITSNAFKGICLFLFAVFAALTIAFLSEATSGEIAQTLATLLVGFVATLAVSSQIYFASVQAKKDHETSLKLSLYKEIAEKVRLCMEPIIELGALHREYQTEMVLNEQTDGRILPKIRYETISEKWRNKCLAVSAIRGLIEDWLVVDARLDLFKLAINSADHEVEKQYQLYIDAAITSLPREFKNSDDQFVVDWKPLESAARASLDAVSDQLHSNCLTLLTYTQDFRDQMQMSLLNSLFPDSKIPIRKPNDPKFVVLNLENADELEKHFLTQTKFGQKITCKV